MNTKKPYHKENLRRDLLEAGRAYVKAHGHLNLSIRTLAQQVGVSPGAPYHHFPDRRSFLLALAIEGFREMMDGTRIVAAAKMSAAEKLRRMGILFIRFTEENPYLIDLMYESELTTPTLDPELLQYQVMGHDALRNCIVEALPGLADAEADLRVVTYWSAIYGYATMRKKGVIHTNSSRLVSLDFSEAVVERVGLAVLTP